MKIQNPTAKILAGVLFSGENEYEECLTSIRSQIDSEYEILVVRNLPKFEAHRKLYSSFLERREVFDYLIKIDADMVLTTSTLFKRINEKFNQHPEIDVLGIAITDFFSGGYINGLNSYRNNVNWVLDPKSVNADTVVVDKDRYYFDTTELAPAAIHCKNPSKLQAFHYGVHRGLKSIAKQHSTSHWALLNKTWQNFLRTKDERIGLAVLGAELVYAGIFTKTDVDYTNPRVKHVLEKYETMCIDDLKHEISTLKIRHWGFLPGDMRRRLLRQKYKNW